MDGSPNVKRMGKEMFVGQESLGFLQGTSVHLHTASLHVWADEYFSSVPTLGLEWTEKRNKSNLSGSFHSFDSADK